MKIIKDKNTNLVIYAGDDLQLTEVGVIGKDFIDYTNNPGNVELLDATNIPEYFRGGMFIYTAGTFVGDADYMIQVARGLAKEKLAEIDQSVKTLADDGNIFEFAGNRYYTDYQTITGYLAALPYLPEDFSISWKTADKDIDGLTNIEVQLDKPGIVGLAMAYLSYRSAVWSAGEAGKKQLKKMAGDKDKSVAEIASFKHQLNITSTQGESDEINI